MAWPVAWDSKPVTISARELAHSINQETDEMSSQQFDDFANGKGMTTEQSFATRKEAHCKSMKPFRRSVKPRAVMEIIS